MPYIADLHIHSLHSRATSKDSTLHGLAAWAAIKGIDLVATGDFTHPGWFAHLNEHLEPAEPGFFRLKQTPSFETLASILPPGVQPDTSRIRFVLSAEISSIYKRGGKVRKIHSLLYAPDFDSVRRISSTLAGIGKILYLLTVSLLCNFSEKEGIVVCSAAARALAIKTEKFNRMTA